MNSQSRGRGEGGGSWKQAKLLLRRSSVTKACKVMLWFTRGLTEATRDGARILAEVIVCLRPLYVAAGAGKRRWGM